jgi:2-polyprenyl-3-methyl-5-hydroxy-6-metoxy-1,4-benzoquinol methylase
VSYVERIVPGQAGWQAYIAGHRHRYRFAAAQFVRGNRVLDAGCGVGYGSRMLVDAGATEVIGVDISEVALQEARQHFAHPRVSFVQDNCEMLTQVTGPFDVIVAFESLEHFHQPESFLKRVAHLLSPDGVFVCSVPNSLVVLPDNSGRPQNPFHAKEYTPGELGSLLRGHFEAVTVMAQHLTAAYKLAKQSALIWANPLFRLGNLLQALWGHKLRWKPPIVECTEADYVMREEDLDSAEVLVGVCRYPRTSKQEWKQNAESKLSAITARRDLFQLGPENHGYVDENE